MKSERKRFLCIGVFCNSQEALLSEFPSLPRIANTREVFQRERGTISKTAGKRNSSAKRKAPLFEVSCKCSKIGAKSVRSFVQSTTCPRLRHVAKAGDFLMSSRSYQFSLPKRQVWRLSESVNEKSRGSARVVDGISRRCENCAYYPARLKPGD